MTQDNNLKAVANFNLINPSLVKDAILSLLRQEGCFAAGQKVKATLVNVLVKKEMAVEGCFKAECVFDYTKWAFLKRFIYKK